jgi:transposase
MAYRTGRNVTFNAKTTQATFDTFYDIARNQGWKAGETFEKAVGPHFGLTPKRYRSGETHVAGRISKMGDAGVRAALYEAANVILTRPVKGSTLNGWEARLATRAGMHKAKVALARKLAIVLHRMLADETTFVADRAAAHAAA